MLFKQIFHCPSNYFSYICNVPSALYSGEIPPLYPSKNTKYFTFVSFAYTILYVGVPPHSVITVKYPFAKLLEEFEVLVAS